MSVNTKITFKHAIDVIRRSIYQKNYAANPLGRWKLYTNKNINLVVDYSNEDHCGICSQYIEKKRIETIIKLDDFNDEYEYLLSNGIV